MDSPTTDGFADGGISEIKDGKDTFTVTLDVSNFVPAELVVR